MLFDQNRARVLLAVFGAIKCIVRVRNPSSVLDSYFFVMVMPLGAELISFQRSLAQ